LAGQKLQSHKQVKQGFRDLTTQEKQVMSFLSALTTEGQTWPTQDHEEIFAFFHTFGTFLPLFLV
jgi:hypothetical protein